MTVFFNDPPNTSGEPLEISPEAIAIHTSNTYTAYSEDLDFMWRWRIYRDNKMVQEGCSLTLDASRRAVQHVLSFFNVSQLHAQ
ncbi:MAG: soluble methane monooxygenase-binding protein MmoD [Methylovulum sp.]|uniref:soluble methane monooxygenase-binding protein MmoD n=1 Tax=Methylovulum sp. TaxID=1916980 RepID=UPI00262573F6|nr:soluble methane monooxygenase-binding protein MmoD [Methylovulum sp.]MDD2722579.1 soluble methane monooxygenase-binding protein MmoD [Methylovulum sp.]MDD5123107.1 soluble methane monooxygenase-binding protein MmoD [Methylovulum sp.]